MYIRHCCSEDATKQIANVNIFLIFFINLSSTLLAYAQSIIYRKNLKNLWTQLRSLNGLLRKRLNHEIDYRQFVKSFNISAMICSVLIIVTAVVRLVITREWTSISAQVAVVFFHMSHFYAKLHAFFVVDLFHFIYKKFNKYVDLAYHLNSSHMIFFEQKDILGNLKFYQEVHRKLWSTVRQINAFFGLSLLAIVGQTFFSASYTIYQMYCQWSFELYKFLSKFCLGDGSHLHLLEHFKRLILPFFISQVQFVIF